VTKSISNLTPKQFEEMVYDILDAERFENLTWREGGGDSGRDIEATTFERDASGYQDKFIWFCDAKLYARGVPFEKIQPALSPATATKPHYLLFAVYPHLTPQCKDLLDEWKSKNNPSFRVRLWEKKDIWKRLRRHPEVIR